MIVLQCDKILTGSYEVWEHFGWDIKQKGINHDVTDHVVIDQGHDVIDLAKYVESIKGGVSPFIILLPHKYFRCNILRNILEVSSVWFWKSDYDSQILTVY